MLEVETRLYREAMVAVANSKGVEVPGFHRTGDMDEEQLREYAEQLREWLDRILFKPSADEEKPGGAGSRGRGARSRGLSVRRGKRTRATDRSNEEED